MSRDAKEYHEEASDAENTLAARTAAMLDDMAADGVAAFAKDLQSTRLPALNTLCKNTMKKCVDIEKKVDALVEDIQKRWKLK